MKRIKTGGYNFVDLEKDNSDLQFNLGEERNMDKELRIGKKKRKADFGFLFPAPKNNEDMGMNNFGKGKPFEGVL